MLDLLGLFAFLSWEIYFNNIGNNELKKDIRWVDQLVFFSFGTFQLIWYSFYLIICLKLYLLVERYNSIILMLEGWPKRILKIFNVIVALIFLTGATHFFLLNAIICFIYSFNSAYKASENMLTVFGVLEWFEILLPIAMGIFLVYVHKMIIDQFIEAEKEEFE